MTTMILTTDIDNTNNDTAEHDHVQTDKHGNTQSYESVAAPT